MTASMYQTEEIGRLARFEYGKSQVAVRSPDGPVPVFGTGGLLERASEPIHPGPSVIVGRKGSLGSPIFSAGPFWAVDTTYYVAEAAGSMGWLYYLLCWLRLENYNEATGVPSLARPTLNRIRVPYPCPTCQDAIRRVLETTDQAIEQTEALLAKQQRIKSGLTHDLLTRGLDANRRLREPSTHQFKDSELGPIPKEWNIGGLLDATDPSRQPILTGPFGADLGIKDFLPDGVPVLRIGNVQQGELDLSDLLFVSPAKAEELSRYRVRTGDLLFARQGASTGRNALATESVDGWLINYHIIRVALDHSRCAPHYIEAVFNSDSVKRQVDRDKGRGTREGINTAQLKALQLRLAPVEEQREIAKVLAACARREAQITTALAKLRRVKAGLMQDLLTGRVPVTPLLSGFPTLNQL